MRHFFSVAAFEGDVHDGAVVLVIVGDIIVIDETLGHVYIAGRIAPQDLVHLGQGFDFFFDALRLVQADVFDHQPRRTGIAEFLFHQPQALF